MSSNATSTRHLPLTTTCHNGTETLPFETYGYGIIVPAISGTGVICNTLNLLVLASPCLTESTYTYLSALAWADLLSLILFFFSGFARGFYDCNYEWNLYQIYVYLPFGFMTTTCSVLFTVSVTVERFIILYFPLKGKLLMFQAQKARHTVALMCAFSVVYNIPKFFVFQTDAENNITYSEFGGSIYYQLLSWLHLIVFSLGSCIVLIVLNVLLIRGFRRSMHRKKILKRPSEADRFRKDQHKLTKTLIAIIFVFVIGELPSALLSRAIATGVFNGGKPEILYQPVYRHALVVATILVVSHQSLNFLFYCMFNQRFLAVFKARMCPCFQNRVNGPVEIFVTEF